MARAAACRSRRRTATRSPAARARARRAARAIPTAPPPACAATIKACAYPLRAGASTISRSSKTRTRRAANRISASPVLAKIPVPRPIAARRATSAIRRKAKACARRRAPHPAPKRTAAAAAARRLGRTGIQSGCCSPLVRRPRGSEVEAPAECEYSTAFWLVVERYGRLRRYGQQHHFRLVEAIPKATGCGRPLSAPTHARPAFPALRSQTGRGSVSADVRALTVRATASDRSEPNLINRPN
jgi:hypothetical protein